MGMRHGVDGRVDVLLKGNQSNQPGIIFLELGLPRPLLLSLCIWNHFCTFMSFHSNRTPFSSSPLPPFPPLLPLLQCFRCKINIRLHSCTIFRPISRDLEQSVPWNVKLTGPPSPCSMQEWFHLFKSICPRFEMVVIWGLILSHFFLVLKVFTLCPTLYMWCF